MVHPTFVSVLLSASVERCFVSRLKDFFVGYFGPHNCVSRQKRGTNCIAQNSAGALWRLYNSGGRTLKAPKFSWAKIGCKFAPRSFWAFEVRPALWTLQSAPRGVLEQCNVCPALSRGQNTHKNHLKLRFSYFLKGFFVNHFHTEHYFVYCIVHITVHYFTRCAFLNTLHKHQSD